MLLCLLFLTALTLLGLSASSDAVLQNQLVANFRDTELAKQSARAALRWVEQWLLELDGPPPGVCVTACSGANIRATGSMPPRPEHADLSWWQTNGMEAGIDPLTGELTSTFAASSVKPPHWVIELAHEDLPTDDTTATLQSWYRLLVRATGQKDTTISVVESIVVRSWPSANDKNFSTAGTGGSKTCFESAPIAKCGRESWRQLR